MLTRPSAFSFLRPGLSDPAIKINPFYAEFISQDIIWYISVYCRQTGHKYIYFNSEWTGQYVKYILFVDGLFSLRWRHNERDSVSNHQPHDCLLNRLFGRRSKKTSKLRVTGLCAGNSPGTGEFPAQMASYAENVVIWWRHHVLRLNGDRGMIINYILYFLWDVITQTCPNLNGDSTIPPLDLILRGSNYICMSI